jgi:hypothetical protein
MNLASPLKNQNLRHEPQNLTGQKKLMNWKGKQDKKDFYSFCVVYKGKE